MAVTNDIKGARLEFVLRPIKGKRNRVIHSYDKAAKKLVTTEAVDDDGGYMLFTPTGNSYRLTKEQMLKRGFDRQPTIIDFDNAKADTPAGRFKFAITDDLRKRAWKEMEEEVIKLCRRRAGHSIPEAVA